MKSLTWYEKAGMLVIALILAFFLWLFITAASTPTKSEVCLNSESPRRYTPNYRVCQEWSGRGWVTIYDWEYNDPAVMLKED